MDETLYWCWLQQAMRCGARVDEALAAFGSPKAIYESSEYERRISGAFTVGQIERLKEEPLRRAEETLNTCARYSIAVLTPDDARYPQMLRPLPNYPCVLYVRGDADVLREMCAIAVVGARKASDYAVQAAYSLSFALSRAGMTVVSGGALGIDSAAHRAAIDAGGKTVCYLGCGFGVRYLMENSPLRREISEHGALVSEYPPGTPAGKSTFPIRNRLISGSSLGTLVVEAGVKSGSLITAKGAREMGRDVFAVPGNILTSTFDGANQLIRDGAKPVFSARDILEEYDARFPDKLDMSASDVPITPPAVEKPVPRQKAPAARRAQRPAAERTQKPAETVNQKIKNLPAEATDEMRQVFQAVSGSALRADEITERTGIPMRNLLRVLTQLEVMGYIVQQQGKKYLASKE